MLIQASRFGIAASGLIVALLSGCGAAGSSNGPGVATGPPGQTLPTASSTPRFTPGSPGSTAGGSGGEAADVVQRYFDALQGSDCTTAFGLLADPLRRRVVSAQALCRASGSGQESQSATVGTLSGDSSSGQVSVQVTVTVKDGTVHNDSVVVVNRAGQWKISDIVVSPSGGTGGQISMDSVVATIQQQFPAQAGGASVTLRCARSGSFPASPGDSFSCGYTSSTGSTGTITVTITSAKGDFTWSIG